MKDRNLPKFFSARQIINQPRVAQPENELIQRLSAVFGDDRSLKGKKIAIAVGSRGICSLAQLVKAAVSFFKSHAAYPFIVPAMGSHGGGSAAGQEKLLADYGVCRNSVAAEIVVDMQTVLVAEREEFKIYCAETAWQADGIFLINRIKPHTSFKGRIESGLCKMLAVGLGKVEGARSVHSRGAKVGMVKAVEEAVGELLSHGKFIAGIAVVENACHQIAEIEVLKGEELLQREPLLLKQAKKLMPKLPLRKIDILYIQEIGKNISGLGMDSNIIGRSSHGFQPGIPWQSDMPAIFRIIVSSLSPESHGNALGMGLADFATGRFERSIDFDATALNAATATSLAAAKMPVIVKNDREAFSVALETCLDNEADQLIACIRNTLQLDELLLSAACLDLVKGRPDLKILSEPHSLQFDPDGYLIMPWSKKK